MNKRQRKKIEGLVNCDHVHIVSCGEGYYEYYCKLNGRDCMFCDCKHQHIAKRKIHWVHQSEKIEKRHPLPVPFNTIFNLDL